MTRFTNWMAVMAFLGAIAASGPVFAQQPPPDDNAPVKFGSGFMRKMQVAGPPEVKAPPQAWPRLDAGAVMCRTEADLDRLAARRRGDAVTGAVECSIVRNATPIDIVQRKGPGRTEFKSKVDGTMPTGWTDAWLPDKAPVSGKR